MAEPRIRNLPPGRVAGTTCTKCGRPRDRGKQRWCKACHAAYMRLWRRRQRVKRARAIIEAGKAAAAAGATVNRATRETHGLERAA